MKLARLGLLALIGAFWFLPVSAADLAPRFRIGDLKNRVFDSAKAKGPLVLSFFFTRCVPCMREVPALYQMMHAAGKEKQLLFIDPYFEGLGIAEDPDTLRAIKRFAFKYKVPKDRFLY